jgi:SAM-dependent methyltransferase
MEMSTSNATDLCALLSRLYGELSPEFKETDYYKIHAEREYLKHHVNVFLWYLQYLPESGSILDWGCNHGPDSCLLRKVFDDRYDLHSCDFHAETDFRVFRDFSRSRYTQLNNLTSLPYAESSFDVVIGSGVLEHTAMDQEALKGLFHVLKPEGILILTYLPFKWSYSEWYRRRIEKANFHRRLYTKPGIEGLLKSWGFYPLEIAYQTFVPDIVDDRRPNLLKRMARPIRRPFFSHSVLCCVARKMTQM